MTQAEIERLKAAKAKHPAAGRRSLAQLAGVSDGKAKRFLRGETRVSGGKAAAVGTGGTMVVKGKTLTDFRLAYDKATIIPAKIKAALKALGANGWDYEVQFARMAGVSNIDLSAFRDQFAGYIVGLKDNRRAWAGSVKTATLMKEMI
jgi:hypothetical protein